MSQPTPLMPHATASWLVDNTALTFEQIAEFCGLHILEVQAMADGEAHQNGQHHGRHAGCLDDGIDADGDGTEPEQGGQVIFQPLRQNFPQCCSQ